MIPTSFEYVRAESLKDALRALDDGNGTKVIAGGHSLLPIMKFRLAQPTRLVDISRLEDLKGISEKGRGARIGAGTTYREVLESKVLRERFPLIVEATHTIGDLQVRNRGTIGGSLAHADPASDMPAVMLALDATFNLRSKSGKRSVKAREFFQGPFTTALAGDELLTDIVLPPLPAGSGSAYLSHDHPASGYAIVAVAAVVALKRKTVSHAVAALTGVGETAFLARSVEGLIGTKGEPEALSQAAIAATAGKEVNGDTHAPAEYRRHLATVMTRRALATALERAG
ncbi:MAG TPA: xanthine dehydrogenase family protein subunit M [Gemmatimonadales bacterium]|nr:xanthine dehydrogenase family protein subunit M [Gemmatimonadales bacterium]